MSGTVLDTSALIAFIQNERGAEIVENAIGDARISAVNLSEAFAVFIRRGVPRAQARAFIASTGVVVEPFDVALAEEAGALISVTQPFGLSLGDRACLALAIRLQRDVLTADAVWTKLSLPVTITPIR